MQSKYNFVFQYTKCLSIASGRMTFQEFKTDVMELTIEEAFYIHQRHFAGDGEADEKYFYLSNDGFSSKRHETEWLLEVADDEMNADATYKVGLDFRWFKLSRVLDPKEAEELCNAVRSMSLD